MLEQQLNAGTVASAEGPAASCRRAARRGCWRAAAASAPQSRVPRGRPSARGCWRLPRGNRAGRRAPAHLFVCGYIGVYLGVGMTRAREHIAAKKL